MTEGIVPVMRIEKEGFGPGSDAAEVSVIAHYRELGHRLTNLTEGGGGAANRGRKESEEAVAKKRGRKRSPEAIEKTAAARRGMKHTAQSRAKMRASHLGVPLSPEHTANRAKARIGSKCTDEHRRRVSCSIEKWHAVRRAHGLLHHKAFTDLNGFRAECRRVGINGKRAYRRAHQGGLFNDALPADPVAIYRLSWVKLLCKTSPYGKAWDSLL